MSLKEYTILPPWRSYRCTGCGRDYSYRSPDPSTPMTCRDCQRIAAETFNRSDSQD